MKSFRKSAARTFKSNWLRFLLSFLMAFISVLFSSGAGFTTGVLDTSFEDSINSQHVSDLIIKSTSDTLSFSGEFTSYVSNLTEIKEKETYTCIDLKEEGMETTRIYLKDLKNSLNSLELVECDYPSNGYEVLAEYGRGERKDVEVGMKLPMNLRGMTFDVTVTGIVKSPLYGSSNREPSMLNEDETVSYILHFSKDYGVGMIPSILLGGNEIAVKIKDEASLDNDYFKEIETFRDEIVDKFPDEKMVALTLKENASIGTFKELSKSMRLLSYVVPVFFVLVSCLIVSVSFKRLIMDERAMIACYVSLGVPFSKIRAKYM